MRIRIGHAQLACTPGNVPVNAERVLQGLREAHDRGLDIVSFPESFLTGYFRAEERAREHSLAADGAVIADLVNATRDLSPTLIVGFNERRGPDLRNTVLIAENGKLLGTYSKAFPCFTYFTPGRDFPIFEKKGVRFGVIICADGGYIEPCRILALKGARLIFAPHYNTLPLASIIDHVQKVRADHIARAHENGVWFVRGNNVGGPGDRELQPDGLAYGESYILDPLGEIVCRSSRYEEDLITAELDVRDYPPGKKPFFLDGRDASRRSGAALRDAYLGALAAARDD